MVKVESSNLASAICFWNFKFKYFLIDKNLGSVKRKALQRPLKELTQQARRSLTGDNSYIEVTHLQNDNDSYGTIF